MGGGELQELAQKIQNWMTLAAAPIERCGVNVFLQENNVFRWFSSEKSVNFTIMAYFQLLNVLNG